MFFFASKTTQKRIHSQGKQKGRYSLPAVLDIVIRYVSWFSGGFTATAKHKQNGYNPLSLIDLFKTSFFY